MKKRSLSVIALLAFTAGCSAEEKSTEETIPFEAEVKEESIAEEKVDPLAMLEKSEWYTSITQNSDITFEEQIDFNNDGTTEVLLGVTDTSAQEVSIYAGGFNSDSEEWSGIYEYALPYSLHASLNYLGTMRNGEDERLAAVSIFDASATGGTDTLKLLRYSSENESIRIIEAFNHPSFISEGAEPPVLNQETNELTLSVFQEKHTYSLTDDHLVSELQQIQLFDGLPLTDDQDFIDLLNHDYFKSGTRLGDTYDQALINDPNVTSEHTLYGGHHTNYENYSFSYDGETKQINYLSLFGFEDLTLESLEEVIGQTIKIEEAYNEVFGEVIISGTFTFGGREYYLELDESGEMVRLLSTGI